MDASIVPEQDVFLNDDDDFMKDIMDSLEDVEVKVHENEELLPLKEKDHVIKYHDMIRHAMADWGDEIIDTLIVKFKNIPKVVSHIQAVRKEMIDPLRGHLE